MTNTDLFRHRWTMCPRGNQLRTEFNLYYQTVICSDIMTDEIRQHTEDLHEVALLRKVRNHDELIDDVMELRHLALRLSHINHPTVGEMDEINTTFDKIIHTLQGRPDPLHST